jgi:hypothetical protein
LTQFSYVSSGVRAVVQEQLAAPHMAVKRGENLLKIAIRRA